MKKFADPAEQLKKTTEFLKEGKTAGFSLALKNLSFVITQKNSEIQNLQLDGELIIDSDIYKELYPLFTEIFEKISDKFSLFKAFEISEETINWLKERDPANLTETEKAEICLKFLEPFGIDKERLRNKEEGREEILEKMCISSSSETIHEKMQELLFLSKEEMNQLLNGFIDYCDVHEKVRLIADPKLKKYLSLNLHRDAVEIYLKLLKEIYSKEKKVSVKDIRNRKQKEMYKYFEEHYPSLYSVSEKDLRNDTSHLKYEIGDSMLQEEIDRQRKVVITKAFTAFLARQDFIVQFFKQSSLMIGL